MKLDRFLFFTLCLHCTSSCSVVVSLEITNDILLTRMLCASHVILHRTFDCARLYRLVSVSSRYCNSRIIRRSKLAASVLSKRA